MWMCQAVGTTAMGECAVERWGSRVLHALLKEKDWRRDDGDRHERHWQWNKSLTQWGHEDGGQLPGAYKNTLNSETHGLAPGLPWLWAMIDTWDGEGSLFKLDLLEGSHSLWGTEGHIWVSGPDAARGLVDVCRLGYHLMPWGHLWSKSWSEAMLTSVGCSSPQSHTGMSGLWCSLGPCWYL